MARIGVRRIAGALGAEIEGVDIGKGLDAETVATVRQALLDHLVVFFHDQDISSDAFMAFASAFGSPARYPLLPGIEGYPMITEIIKHEHETNNFGGIWHADTTYLEHPPMGSMLYALEVPAYGGDTMWANQYLAYEALSEKMRGVLEELVGVNTSAKADVSKTREDMIRSTADKASANPHVAEHPVVRTHPETGRKSLFVNVAHTSHFKGMTEAESEPILNYLFQHQARPEFTCRFRWRQGSLAFWDNRASQHNPINDYHGHRRVMRRITLAGEKPA